MKVSLNHLNTTMHEICVKTPMAIGQYFTLSDECPHAVATLECNGQIYCYYFCSDRLGELKSVAYFFPKA
jgi:hypothetical protein